MTSVDLVFLLLAVAGGLSAVLVVTSKNLIHAALFLAASLTSVGGVFFVLKADFIALVQLIVYVGAVAVLFLFGLMLTRAPIGREALDSQSKALGLGVASAMFGVLAALIVQAFKDVETAQVTGSTLESIGVAIFSSWVLPFEIASLLLLAALVGAIVLSRREEGDGDEQAPASVPTLAEPPAERDRTAEDQPKAPVAGGRP